MFRMLTAHTDEFDDVPRAVASLLAQLDLPNRLCAHSIGLLACHADCIETGLVRALCDALPFDVIGSTTLASSVPGAMDHLQLSLCVLTGDEVRFSAALARPATRVPALSRAYKEALNGLQTEPTLVIGYRSIFRDMGGWQALVHLNDLAGGAPLFGNVTIDHTRRHLAARVFYQGEAYDDAFVLALVSGVAPTFLMSSIPRENIRRQQAIITAAEGALLKEVNGMPVLQYLSQIGLEERDGLLIGIDAIPFMLDYEDGTSPVARAIFDITPEGYAMCGGDMPVNTTLSIGSIDAEDVMQTSAELSEAIRAKPPSGVLIFSCLVRNIALGFATMREMEQIAASLDGVVPYHFSYSGGEVCPAYTTYGRHVNRFHNGTIIACLL